MSEKDFHELVCDMRMAQKQSFKAPQGSAERVRWMMESERLERLVDEEIEAYRRGQIDLLERALKLNEESVQDQDNDWWVLRARMRLPLREASRRIGISASRLSQIECGKSEPATDEEMEKINAFYGKNENTRRDTNDTGNDERHDDGRRLQDSFLRGILADKNPLRQAPQDDCKA